MAAGPLLLQRVVAGDRVCCLFACPRAMPVALPPHRTRVALYHERNPMLSVDSWAACEKIHEHYLAETERRRKAGLPTY
jgi:hypothetical protein